MGDYSVPENIRKLKPVGTMVKKVHNHYYVYEFFNRKNEKNKWHTVMGKMIGRIDENIGFIPNDNYMKLDEITTLNYGQYSLVLNNSNTVIDRLCDFFNPEDAYRIYLLALLHFVHGFIYLKDVKKYYDQSYFSVVYPNLSFGYESLGKLLDNIGRRQTRVLQFEQSLIEQSSKNIAIDGHVVSSSSHCNELAQNGYKFNLLKDSQINVLMGYDVKNATPLFSRVYSGSNLDKISVQDTLDRHEFENVLFIVDRGFYSEANIKLFSKNNNQYIIPLSPNYILYKQVTENMNLTDEFVYETSGKNTIISYREVIVGNKRVIIYRDTHQNTIDKSKYLKNIESDSKKYTKEKYDAIKDYFGVIVLETNILDKTPQEIYMLYKKRWSIETYYNYLKNNVNYEALALNDYYMTEGLSFIMLITGMIHSEIKKAVTDSVKGKSIDDCMLEAAFLKIHKLNNKWKIENIKTKTKEMMELLGVDFEKERKFINK